MTPRRLLAAALLGLTIAGGLLLTRCGDEDPAWLVAKTPQVDYGRALFGDAVVGTVVLKNGGAHEVAITKVDQSCGCFRIHAFQRMVQPGETRTIEVTLVTSEVSPGPLKGKKLRILSNDPIQPLIEIDMVGDIVASCTIDPSVVDLGRLDTEEARAPRVVEVRPGPDVTLTLVWARISPRGVLGLETRSVEGGFDLEIRLLDDATGRGPLPGAVELRLEAVSEGFGTRNLDFVVRVQGRWPD